MGSWQAYPQRPGQKRSFQRADAACAPSVFLLALDGNRQTLLISVDAFRATSISKFSLPPPALEASFRMTKAETAGDHVPSQASFV